MGDLAAADITEVIIANVETPSANRTFFFASWDVSLLHEKIPGVYTVPTVKQRNNDLSENPNVVQFGIFDPMSTKFDPTTNLFRRQPFLNPDGSLATSVPANRLDPVAVFYMSQFPTPNYLDPRQQNAASGPARCAGT